MVDDTPEQDVVSARRFVLRASNGTTRAVLEIDPADASCFSLCDKGGKPKAVLTVSAGGDPVLSLYGEADTVLAELRVMDTLGSAGLTLGREGSPQVLLGAVAVESAAFLSLREASGDSAATLKIARGAPPSLDLYDQQGKPRIGITILPDGSANFGLLDLEGVRTNMAVATNGESTIALMTPQNALRVGLRLDEKGNAGLYLADADASLTGMIVQGLDGGPIMTFFDSKKQRMWVATAGSDVRTPNQRRPWSRGFSRITAVTSVVLALPLVLVGLADLNKQFGGDAPFWFGAAAAVAVVPWIIFAAGSWIARGFGR